jgi:hypothetical protein
MNPQKVYSVHGFFLLDSGGRSAVSGEALLRIIARGWRKPREDGKIKLSVFKQRPVWPALIFEVE